jgi:dihydroorotate dehydrogenase
MYKYLIKPFLFLFSPETAHRLVFSVLSSVNKIPGIPSLIKSIYTVRDKRLERIVFGIKFPNAVGLGAGFDKDGKYIEELSNLGFGFIEIGTVTPLTQPGNEKPRCFRLPEDEALINRMGFNNEGMEQMAARLRNRKPGIIVGGNIGKNKITPNENAIHDYELCFDALHDYVDYFVVNVSSPNTPNLRQLQEKEPLTKLLMHLKSLNNQKRKPKPILLKIAPDLTNEQLDDIIEIVIHTRIDGVVATNTTISREGLKTDESEVKSLGMGGLSGKPLTRRSTEVIKYLSSKSNKAFPIIGVGGIHSPEDALEKLNAGADLIQIYTGFIYEGPSIIKKINKKILNTVNPS